MNTSFSERLARINENPSAVAPDPNVDLIGSSGTKQDAADKHYQAPEPLTYDQRFKQIIINNIIMGFAWMAATGFVAVNFWTVSSFFAGSSASQESLLNTQIGLAVGLAVSFGLFYWVARQAIKDLGKLHGMPMSLAIGGAIGVALGAGPVAAYNFYTGQANEIPFLELLSKF